MVSKNQLHTGSILGGSLLIAGCCIGAGMLGLPVITAQAGFGPSLLMFALSWLFMTCTALLVLEVNLWFKDEVSFVSMAHKTLGPVGKWISWTVFAFLFYSLMAAYIAGTGNLVVDFCKEVLHISMPHWMASLLFVVTFGYFIFLGTKAVDGFNRILMIGLIATYCAIVLMGSSHVNFHYLLHYDWSASIFVIPVMIISFGFHNLIPTLKNYFQGDLKRLRWTIIIGSAIPLAIYLIWEGLILGIVPLQGEGGFQQALDQGEMATRTLKNIVGSSLVVTFAEYFAFFAIVTSFLGVALSFVDFLSDGLHIHKTSIGKALLCGLAIIPPFIFALFNPKAFLVALNYAGAFGAVILFGILPALMVWVGRYKQKLNLHPLVPGGKISLIVIILFAVAVVVLQLTQEISNLMN